LTARAQRRKLSYVLQRVLQSCLAGISGHRSLDLLRPALKS